MSPHPSNEPVSNGGGSRQFWLFLLLIVLIVALVVYDHGAVRHYGQQAYSGAEHAAQKASKWAKNLYACGIPGCGPKSGNVITSPMQTGPGKVAVADPNTNTAPAAPNAPAATNTEPAAGADTQAAPPENTVAGDQPQASGVVSYPAYPPYPAYPNYPPDASFGARGFGADSAPSLPSTVFATQTTETGGRPRQARVPGLSGIPAESLGRNPADDATAGYGATIPRPASRSACRPACQRGNGHRWSGSSKKVGAGGPSERISSRISPVPGITTERHRCLWRTRQRLHENGAFSGSCPELLRSGNAPD